MTGKWLSFSGMKKVQVCAWGAVLGGRESMDGGFAVVTGGNHMKKGKGMH